MWGEGGRSTGSGCHDAHARGVAQPRQELLAILPGQPKCPNIGDTGDKGVRRQRCQEPYCERVNIVAMIWLDGTTMEGRPARCAGLKVPDTFSSS